MVSSNPRQRQCGHSTSLFISYPPFIEQQRDHMVSNNQPLSSWTLQLGSLWGSKWGVYCRVLIVNFKYKTTNILINLSGIRRGPIQVQPGAGQGEAVHVDPIKPMLKAPKTKRYKLNNCELLPKLSFESQLAPLQRGHERCGVHGPPGPPAAVGQGGHSVQPLH
jgi:hypothetical protein